VIIKPIGVIHTEFKSKEETPVQGAFAPDSKGTVELDQKYAEGLKDIDTFSHIILLYQFNKAGKVVLVRPTFLSDEPHGVFERILKKFPDKNMTIRNANLEDVFLKLTGRKLRE